MKSKMVIEYILTVPCEFGGVIVTGCGLLRYATIRRQVKTDKDENIFTDAESPSPALSRIVMDINEVKNGQ